MGCYTYGIEVTFNVLDDMACVGELGNDEEPFMNNTLSNCLSWKEILSSIDKYHKVNSFLVEHDILMYKNVILPKSLYLCIIRIEIIKRMARGEEQALISNISKCAREEREAGAIGGMRRSRMLEREM